MSIKQWFCNHEFQLLTTYQKDIDKSVGYRAHSMHIIYCPKCKRQEHVYEWTYRAIVERQKVDKEYEEFKRLKRERNN